MRKGLIGVMLAALIVISTPALSLAIAAWPAWITQTAYSAKVQVKYVNGVGSTVAINRTLVNDGSGYFVFHGPDGDNNAMVLFIVNDASGASVKCSPLGTAITKSNKYQFFGSWDSGAENTWPTSLTLDGGSIYMNPADVNASYAEVKATVNSTTNFMNIKMKATIVGLLHTPDGAFPAQVIIRTGVRDMLDATSLIPSFDRPLVWPVP